jgi:hypothetical protein
MEVVSTRCCGLDILRVSFSELSDSLPVLLVLSITKTGETKRSAIHLWLVRRLENVVSCIALTKS